MTGTIKELGKRIRVSLTSEGFGHPGVFKLLQNFGKQLRNGNHGIWSRWLRFCQVLNMGSQGSKEIAGQ